MSVEVLSPARIVRLVGAIIFQQLEPDIEVQRPSMSLFQTVGYTPDGIRTHIYVAIDWDMTVVKVTFAGSQSPPFEFKIFANESTEERIMRYLTHYMTKHKTQLNIARTRNFK